MCCFVLSFLATTIVVLLFTSLDTHTKSLVTGLIFDFFGHCEMYLLGEGEHATLRSTTSTCSAPFATASQDEGLAKTIRHRPPSEQGGARVQFDPCSRAPRPDTTWAVWVGPYL